MRQWRLHRSSPRLFSARRASPGLIGGFGKQGMLVVNGVVVP